MHLKARLRLPVRATVVNDSLDTRAELFDVLDQEEGVGDELIPGPGLVLLPQVSRAFSFWPRASCRSPSTSLTRKGGISWGRYGPRTEEAVNKLQDLGGIDPEKGHKGSLFGRDTLKIFETALEAKAKKMDWISAVKKAAIK